MKSDFDRPIYIGFDIFPILPIKMKLFMLQGRIPYFKHM